VALSQRRYKTFLISLALEGNPLFLQEKQKAAHLLLSYPQR
jgi:hypothetical protein